MLARLNSIVRAIRIGIARKLRRPARGELLYADGVFGRVLQVRRAVGIAAVIGAAGWVVLGAAGALQTGWSSSAGSGKGTCSHASVSMSRPAQVGTG